MSEHEHCWHEVMIEGYAHDNLDRSDRHGDKTNLDWSETRCCHCGVEKR